jgi:hypothetical protein
LLLRASSALANLGACPAPGTTSSDSVRAIVRPVTMRWTEDGHSTGRRGRRVGGRLASHPSLSQNEGPRHPKDTPAAIGYPRSGGTARARTRRPRHQGRARTRQRSQGTPSRPCRRGALEAGVVRLYGVVIMVVEVYPRCVHKSSLWAGLRGVTAPPGPSFYDTYILSYSG